LTPTILGSFNQEGEMGKKSSTHPKNKPKSNKFWKTEVKGPLWLKKEPE